MKTWDFEVHRTIVYVVRVRAESISDAVDVVCRMATDADIVGDSMEYVSFEEVPEENDDDNQS